MIVLAPDEIRKSEARRGRKGGKEDECIGETRGRKIGKGSKPREDSQTSSQESARAEDDGAGR